MMLEMYSMYDTATGEYNNPIIFRNSDIATATIIREIENVKHNGNDFQKLVLQDTEFYWIGSFDTQTGDVISAYTKKLVIAGRDFLDGEEDAEEN